MKCLEKGKEGEEILSGCFFYKLLNYTVFKNFPCDNVYAKKYETDSKSLDLHALFRDTVSSMPMFCWERIKWFENKKKGGGGGGDVTAQQLAAFM
jgi:hypothetical protein